MLLDTGARRAELADLQLAHVDVDLDVVPVLGKGRRERALPFGHRAGEALERYLRVLSRYKHAQLQWLWIGLNGSLDPPVQLEKASMAAGLCYGLRGGGAHLAFQITITRRQPRHRHLHRGPF